MSIHVTADTMRDYTQASQEALCDWLRQQGLDPDDTWSVRVIEPLIFARVYVVAADGYKQRHPRKADQAWLRTRWLLLKTPVPSLVATWKNDPTPAARQRGGNDGEEG